MMSYERLRILLVKRRLKISNICKECGISHSIGTRIMGDKSIELKSLEKICLYLNVPIEETVEIIKS